MVQISSRRKHAVVCKCIFDSYQRQLEVFQSFSDNNYTRNQISLDILWSTVNYLRSDLANIYRKSQVKLENISNSSEERCLMEDYVNDLNDMVSLLEESDDLDIEGLIGKVETTECVISQSIIDLFENSYLKMISGFDYKFLDIVHEAGYAFQKFMIFTVSHLNNEDLYHKFEPLSKEVILQLKETLLKFKDKIFVDEFIHYTKLSLQYLYRYLLHIEDIIANQNRSEEMNELLWTLSSYIKSHISIISKALNSENPINNLLAVLDELELQQLTTLKEIIEIVRLALWSSDDEFEQNGFIYHAGLFFTETVQNIISIEDIGKGFHLSKN